MRVLVIYHNFGPHHLARWRHLRESAAPTGVDALGLQVFATPGLHAWEWPGEIAGLHNAGLRSFGDERMRWTDAPRLARALRTVAPDVVVVNGWGTRDALLAHAWCRAEGVARVLLADTIDPGIQARAVREWLKRTVLRGVGGALVGGSPQQRYVERLGVTAAAIRMGCDVVDNAHFAAAIAQRSTQGRRILTVARLSAEKNLLEAAKSFLQFAAQRPPQEVWTWSIAGYGPLEQQIRAVAERSGGRIRWLGAIAYEALPGVMAQADLYWQPSVRDTWALSVNEAMAAGLPVLVSRQCGCSEDLVSADNGWVFDPGGQAMRDALQTAALAQPRWTQMGRNSAHRIGAWGLQRYSDSLLELVHIARASA